jgi:hypothetical protein
MAQSQGRRSAINLATATAGCPVPQRRRHSARPRNVSNMAGVIRVTGLTAEHIRAVYSLPRDLCQQARADIFKRTDISALRISTADWR